MNLPPYLAAFGMLAGSVALAAGPTTTSAPASQPVPASRPAVATGDVVVFLGDELTEVAAGSRAAPPVYPLLVETFLAARCPDRRVRYINAGWAGDTVGRALLRLDRDVLVHKPTVVVICLGLNDPGYLGFAEDRLERFKADLAKLVQRCSQAGARVWLISPPSVEEEKARKARVTRDGRPAVADLQAIRYNATLARYAEAVKEVAGSAGPAAGFVDWFAESRAARSKAGSDGEDVTLTRDGRLPGPRSTALAAAALLRAWDAEPIRVTIDLDWHEGTARVGSAGSTTILIPVQMTEDGKRILKVTGLALPWPMPGGTMGSIEPGSEAVALCSFVFKMADPPERGIVLSQQTEDGRPAGQSTLSASELRAGVNLAAAEPLRSLKGAGDLYKLIAAKNNTQQIVWRRLELSPPKERELAEAHRQLIVAWKTYVAGYEEMIAKYPKTFDATFVLAEAAETERLPTSGPARTAPVPRTPTRGPE